MGSPVKLYQKEMHANLGFFATWLPGDAIEIGDAGLMVNGRFRRVGSLVELGIAFQVGDGGAAQDVKYTSSSGTAIGVSVGAKVGGVAKTEITIDFSREGAFVFHAAGLRSRRLSNRMEVAKAILKAHRAGKWEPTWFLVEALHRAERATIVVSEESASGITLGASVTGIDLPSVSLADPKVELTVKATRGRLVHVVSARDLHPLFSCLRVQDPIFGEPKVEPVRGLASDVEPTLVRPSIEDLLDS